jgi:hypothetical protein
VSNAALPLTFLNLHVLPVLILSFIVEKRKGACFAKKEAFLMNRKTHVRFALQMPLYQVGTYVLVAGKVKPT